MDKEIAIREANISKRHMELESAQAIGEISQLNAKPSLCVQDAFTKNGVEYPQTCYTPCFTYLDKNGKQIVEDVKPVDDHHKLLRTLFEYCYINLSIKDI